MTPTGSAKMSYFSHFCPQTSMQNPSRFSDVEKIAPGIKNERILDPSDPQNHQKTKGIPIIFWKSCFSLRATLRIEKTLKIIPKWPQNGAQNGKKTQKNMKKSMPKSMSISASFVYHFGSILAPFLSPKWVTFSFRSLTFSIFFALGGQTVPQGRPRYQNGAKKRAQGPQK